MTITRKDIQLVAFATQGHNTLAEAVYYHNNKCVHVQLIKLPRKVPIEAVWSILKHREFGIKAAAILG